MQELDHMRADKSLGARHQCSLCHWNSTVVFVGTLHQKKH